MARGNQPRCCAPHGLAHVRATKFNCKGLSSHLHSVYLDEIRNCARQETGTFHLALKFSRSSQTLHLTAVSCTTQSPIGTIKNQPTRRDVGFCLTEQVKKSSESGGFQQHDSVVFFTT